MRLRTVSEAQTRGRLQAGTDELAVSIENVSVLYHVPHERFATLKEHTIRWLERRVHYDDFWALQDVNLKVQRGEVMGIVGRNGAGKSTLLKVIARVLRPTRGRVWIRGRVAPLLEFGAGFHPELTGRENVFLNGAVLGFSRAQMEEKFNRIVDFAELWDFIDAPIRTYSSGMIARLGFAVATDLEPDILIVDELLSVGDAAFQKKSSERIQSFRAAGATILLVSHSLDAVETLCDRAIWLEHGRVAASGATDSVTRQYRGDDAKVEAKRMVQVAGPTETQRSGSRTVEITHVRLTNRRGDDQNVFATGEPMVLEIAFEAHSPVSSPIFGMAIHRQDGLHITGPNTSFSGLTLPTLNGKGKMIYTIPYLPLFEGLYHISVAIVNADDSEIYDYHDRTYPFRITNANSTVRERYGIMTLRGEWKHVVQR